MFTCLIAFIADVTADYTCLGVVIYLPFFVKYPVNVICIVSEIVKNCWFDFPRTNVL